VRKIVGFADYPAGWHYGQGVPPTSRTVARAILFCYWVETLGHTDMGAFPGIDGEIQIVLYGREKEMEITFEVDGTITVAVERAAHLEFYQNNLSVPETLALIRLDREQPCPSFASSTPDITTKSSVDFVAWRSNPHLTEVASQRLTKIAQKRYLGISARTSGAITTRRFLTPPSIGVFRSDYRRPGALSKKEAKPEIIATVT
jgi:hypothetical protein